MQSVHNTDGPMHSVFWLFYIISISAPYVTRFGTPPAPPPFSPPPLPTLPPRPYRLQLPPRPCTAPSPLPATPRPTYTSFFSRCNWVVTMSQYIVRARACVCVCARVCGACVCVRACALGRGSEGWRVG